MLHELGDVANAANCPFFVSLGDNDMPDKFMFSNGEYVATIVSIGDDKMTHMPKDSDTVVPIYPATTQRVLFSVFIPDEIRAKKPKAHQNRIKFASYGFQATPSYIK